MLCTYARLVGATTSVEKWARLGAGAAISGDVSVAVVVLPYSMPWLLREARYGDVMHIARSAGTALAEHNRLRSATTVALGDDGHAGDAAWGDRFAVGTGVLCAVAHLGLLLETGSAIEARVNSLIALCGDLASSGGDRTLWENVACLLHEIFEGEAGYGDLLTKYKTYDACGEANLALIALVGITLRPDVPLKDAAKCHSMVYEYIDRNKSMYDYVYGEILLPFLEEYWQRAFADNRAHFASPNLVAQELEETGRSSVDVRAQEVLSIVLRGLGIRVSGAFGEWLRK